MNREFDDIFKSRKRYNPGLVIIDNTKYILRRGHWVNSQTNLKAPVQTINRIKNELSQTNSRSSIQKSVQEVTSKNKATNKNLKKATFKNIKKQKEKLTSQKSSSKKVNQKKRKNELTLKEICSRTKNNFYIVKQIVPGGLPGHGKRS